MDDEQVAREHAIKRLKQKGDFKMHLGAYLIVNAMLTAIWALSSQGHFWPVWTMIFWGVGLAFHGWYAYFDQGFSEEQIKHEMNKE